MKPIIASGSAFGWDWIPKRSIGPILFGSPARTYIQTLGLVATEQTTDEDGHWEHFEDTQSGLDITALNGKVYAVHCEASCRYNGHEIIGESADLLPDLFRGEEMEITDYEVGVEQFIDRLGLQLWLVDDFVESVAVYME